MGRYVYSEDVIGATNLKAGGCASCGSNVPVRVPVVRKPVIGTRRLGGFRGFGQSGGPRSAAVEKLQNGLRVFAESEGSADYHPGPADGLYGKNTHAALLRISRDYLEPRGAAEATCRSTCNTLWLRAKGACAECLGIMLRGLNTMGIAFAAPVTVPLPTEDESVAVTMQGFSVVDAPPSTMPGEPLAGPLTDAEIAEITGRYRGFLDAYVAKYGDGGELDPAQIARREEMPLEQAEVVAAERRAAAERAAAERAAADRAAAAAAAAAASSRDQQAQQAGFSWWWIVIFLGLGSAVWYAWSQEKKGKGRTSPEEVTEWTGMKRRPKRLPPSPPMGGGCGCGG